MLAFPKLTNDKGIRRKPIWFLFFWGFDESSDLMKMEIMLGWRPDLMHPIMDRGRSIPCVWGLQLRWREKTLRDLFASGPNFQLRTRSEVGEIARRLAGGDE